jgi:hypothetical protein
VIKLIWIPLPFDLFCSDRRVLVLSFFNNRMSNLLEEFILIQNNGEMNISEIVTKEQIIALGGIYFDNIQEGFDKYDYILMEETKEDIIEEIKSLRDLNGLEYSYVDFYYGKLTPEEKNKLKNGLSPSFIPILQRFENLKEAVIISLTDELLNLTAELNEKEILFSTYYFCKFPCTIWGNYNQKYPVLKKKN